MSLTLRQRRTSGVGALIGKIAALAVVDAIAVFVLFALLPQGDWLVFGLVALATVVVNVIYLWPDRFLPAKYLTPGLIFLAMFQIFVVLYSCYIAFTNYGDGHNSNKEDAISQIIAQNTQRIEGSPVYQVQVVAQGPDLGLIVTSSDGTIQVGTAETPLVEVNPSDAELNDAGTAISVPGYTTLTQADIIAQQNAIADLSVPISDDPDDGFIATQNALQGFEFASLMEYDEATDTFTNVETGVTYTDNGEGEFESADGQALTPGWQVIVGFENFTYAFTNQSFGSALIAVTIWTFAFAGLSVVLSFVLGMFLALTLNHPKLRGRQVYRVLAILPYAFPSFLSALVWLGLMNTEFGFINQVLLGGLKVEWLTDPVIAKISVLLVNTWLGFPYMFLVCTGALQSIPEELTEAAKVDGAKPWAIFRFIKFPLLLVSIAPLLISSFAFNFNNFNIIYMLTSGGPRMSDVTENVGHTDLLITLVYKVAFGGAAGANYGLASALAILIFVIVAVISAISFRQTKALEDLN